MGEGSGEFLGWSGGGLMLGFFSSRFDSYAIALVLCSLARHMACCDH